VKSRISGKDAAYVAREEPQAPPYQVHHTHDPLLPYGIETTGHAWLHSRCWLPWYEGRKARAVAILSAMGITPAGRPLEARLHEGA
jgi:hypothetical protein